MIQLNESRVEFINDKKSSRYIFIYFIFLKLLYIRKLFKKRTLKRKNLVMR